MALEPISAIPSATAVADERELQKELNDIAAEKRLAEEAALEAEQVRRTLREDDLIAASERKDQRDADLLEAAARRGQTAELLSNEMQRRADLTEAEIIEDLDEYRRTSTQELIPTNIATQIDEET